MGIVGRRIFLPILYYSKVYFLYFTIDLSVLLFPEPTPQGHRNDLVQVSGDLLTKAENTPLREGGKSPSPCTNPLGRGPGELDHSICGWVLDVRVSVQ